MKEKACKECNRLSDLDICTVCKSPTSQDWIGYVRIIDPENSDVAGRLGIQTKGKFALKVR
jgi:DNA-directed RNA polymerase subunit E"